MPFTPISSATLYDDSRVPLYYRLVCVAWLRQHVPARHGTRHGTRHVTTPRTAPASHDSGRRYSQLCYAADATRAAMLCGLAREPLVVEEFEECVVVVLGEVDALRDLQTRGRRGRRWRRRRRKRRGVRHEYTLHHTTRSRPPLFRTYAPSRRTHTHTLNTLQHTQQYVLQYNHMYNNTTTTHTSSWSFMISRIGSWWSIHFISRLRNCLNCSSSFRNRRSPGRRLSFHPVHDLMTPRVEGASSPLPSRISQCRISQPDSPGAQDLDREAPGGVVVVVVGWGWGWWGGENRGWRGRLCTWSARGWGEST